MLVGGGCAANAAVAVARLGGEVQFAGPLGGPPGGEPISDRILAWLAQECIDCSGCVHVDGATSAISAIFVNARGERTIATYRDKRLDAVTPPDADALAAAADAVVADNPLRAVFAEPICRAALRRAGRARRRQARRGGRSAVRRVLAWCSPPRDCAPPWEAPIWPERVACVRRARNAFIAVTNGAAPVLWRDDAGEIQDAAGLSITAVVRSGPATSFTAPSRWR